MWSHNEVVIHSNSGVLTILSLDISSTTFQWLWQPPPAHISVYHSSPLVDGGSPCSAFWPVQHKDRLSPAAHHGCPPPLPSLRGGQIYGWPSLQRLRCWKSTARCSCWFGSTKLGAPVENNHDLVLDAENMSSNRQSYTTLECPTWYAFSESKSLVALSNIRILGCLINALAMAMRCFWPPDTCPPFSPASVQHTDIQLLCLCTSLEDEVHFAFGRTTGPEYCYTRALY